MHRLIAIIAWLFLISSAQAEAPEWYKNRNLPKDYPTEIIGYGEGKTEEEARANASSEISSQIKTSIKKKLNCTEIVKRTNSSRNKVSEKHQKSCQSEVSQETNQTLSGLKVMESGRGSANRRKPGPYYVAVKYDKASLAEKVFRLLSKNSTDASCAESRISIPLEAKVNKRFEEKHGTTNACFSWELIQGARDHEDPRWQLEVKGEIFPVATIRELEDLFWPNQSSEHLTVDFSKEQIYHSEPFFITIKTPQIPANPFGSHSHYLSLYSVTEAGQVSRLLSNKEITDPNEAHTFPDSESSMTAVITKTDSEVMRELYVAVLCPKRINESKFRPIGKNLLPEKTGRAYGQLLKEIKTKRCHITPQPILVVKR